MTTVSNRKKGWLVCYDISEDSARRRCCKYLRRFSSGYQKSCFELIITQSELMDVVEQILGWINPKTDSLLLVSLNSFSASWQAGKGAISPTGPLLIIQ